MKQNFNQILASGTLISALLAVFLHIRECSTEVTTIASANYEEDLTTTDPLFDSLLEDINHHSISNQSLSKANHLKVLSNNVIPNKLPVILESTTPIEEEFIPATEIPNSRPSELVAHGGVDSRLENSRNKTSKTKDASTTGNEKPSPIDVNQSLNEILAAIKKDTNVKKSPQDNSSDTETSLNNFMQRIGSVDDNNSNANEGVKPIVEDKIVTPSPAPTTTVAKAAQLRNIDELSDSHLDAWRPVWPFPNLDPLAAAIKPTLRFPSVSGPFTRIASTPQSKKENTELFSVPKTPVTAYFFDLSSAVPSDAAAGPLYDSFDFTSDKDLASPSGKDPIEDGLLFPTSHPVESSFLESSFDDYFRNPNLKLPEPIASTPTLSQPVESVVVEAPKEKTILSDSIRPNTHLTKLPELNHRLSSLSNRTSFKDTNSSVEYTLGDADDFHFDKSVPVISENHDLLDPVLPSLSPDMQHAESGVTTGDIPGTTFESFLDANVSLNFIPSFNSSEPLLDTSKDVQNNTSDIHSLSRIPLWKRISQKTTPHPSLSDAHVNTLSFVPNNNIPSLTTTSTYSTFPFDNDIPIGILSPGIFKSNGRHPIESPNDKLVPNPEKNRFAIKNVTIPTNEYLPNYPLESSIQSSTQSSISNDVRTADNDFSHLTSLDTESNNIISSTKLTNKITPSTNDEIVFDTETESSSPSFSASLAEHSIFSPASADPSLIANASHLSNNSNNEPHNKFTFSQTDFETQSVANISTPTPISKVEIKTAPDFMLKVTIEPTRLTPADLDSDSPAFKNSTASETPEEAVLDKPHLHSNEGSSESNDLYNSTVNPNVTEALLPSDEQDESQKGSVENNQQAPRFNDTIPANGSQPAIPNYPGAGIEKTEESTTSAIEEVESPKLGTTDKTVVEEEMKVPVNFTTTLPTNDTEETPDNYGTIPEIISSDLHNETNSFRPTTDATVPSTTSSTTTSTNATTTHIKVTAAVTTSKAVPFEKVSPPPPRREMLPARRQPTKNSTNSSKTGPTLREEKIIVVVGKAGEDEPQLHLIKVHPDGTNSTQPSPYVKIAVSYDVREFCRHKRNIYSLLVEWINKHLTNATDVRPYEIEVFNQPECKDAYLSNNDTKLNRTEVYFYVKENGQISPNLTLSFPKNLKELEISKELNYLKQKIHHLELVNAAPSQDELLIEEAAVGTSIVVAVVVTSLLLILLIAAVLAFIVIRRKRTAENIHGRRCVPAANDAYSLDSVSVFYHSIRRKSRKRASNKSLKSYLNQGFEDPNGPSRPLNFVKLTHCISDIEGIHDEYSNIPAIIPKYDELPRGVEDKNRYANVIPVSETRILLNRNTPKDEYINANYVHGPKSEVRYYIATQAPLDNTVADFWQMIWEQESKVLVMLTDFVEKGIDKCADYLPPSETLDCHRVYGEFQITLKSRDLREKYIVSIVQIKNLENNLVREIAHMWFTGWPHAGVPNEEKSFISFIFDVRTTRKQLRAKGPIIVHCSPGTGRTGTYIACDLAMKQFDEQKVVDIPKTVYRIRRERAGAVQTKEQYAFIYRVVNLYAAKLTTGNLDSF